MFLSVKGSFKFSFEIHCCLAASRCPSRLSVTFSSTEPVCPLSIKHKSHGSCSSSDLCFGILFHLCQMLFLNLTIPVDPWDTPLPTTFAVTLAPVADKFFFCMHEYTVCKWLYVCIQVHSCFISIRVINSIHTFPSIPGNGWRTERVNHSLLIPSSGLWRRLWRKPGCKYNLMGNLKDLCI